MVNSSLNFLYFPIRYTETIPPHKIRLSCCPRFQDSTLVWPVPPPCHPSGTRSPCYSPPTNPFLQSFDTDRNPCLEHPERVGTFLKPKMTLTPLGNLFPSLYNTESKILYWNRRPNSYLTPLLRPLCLRLILRTRLYVEPPLHHSSPVEQRAVIKLPPRPS